MASSIPEATIEEIKARIDLVELISSCGVQVRRAGADYKACCPFHHEKTPSFVIHPEKGYYHCFGCGESGNAFKFLMKQEGLTFVEAVKKLAQQCGVTVEEKANPEAGLRARLYALLAQLAEFYRRCLLQAKEAEGARAYLAKRNLPDAWTEKFCVGYAPIGAAPILTWARKYKFTDEELYAAGVLNRPRYEGDRPYHPFGGRLMFTICDRQGRPVAFSGRILDAAKSPRKYVNSPETLVFKKSHVLFGLDKAAGNIAKAPRREAIVCEGQIDLIRCHACGFGNTVASQGTAFTADHVQLLKKCADAVTLVFDADGAGRKAAIRTGGEFLAAEIPVRVATLPPGEDPDSLLRDQGAVAFRACLERAESITHFQVRTLLEQEERPGSIDAISRVSRAALETLAQCPSAILRASLMVEAAQLLGVPVAALEEDFAKLRKQNRPVDRAPVAPPSPPAPRAEPVRSAAVGTVTAGGDERPEDFFIDSEPPEGLELTEECRPLEPQVLPPPPCEMALCEFLFDHEGDADLEKLVALHLPEEVLSHVFSRQFVAAWRAGVYGAADAFAEMRQKLQPAECAWLDGILLGTARACLSELEPQRILQDLLRQLWIAAIRRRQGELPAASSSENDRRRLTFSSHMRIVQRAPWVRASTLMVSATLA